MKIIQSSTVRSARDSICNRKGLMQIHFLNVMTDLLRAMIRVDQKTVVTLKQEMALIDNVSLHIHHSAGVSCFRSYDRDTKERVGITDDPARIYALARRSFLEDQIKSIESSARRILKVLESTEGLSHEMRLGKRLGKYADAGLDLSRILFTKEQNEWIDASYTPNPFHPESLRYPTTGGITTRSKSEAKIGSDLETIGLPYRYDDIVNIQCRPNEGQPSRDSYFADFKVPNLLGGITIHEHLGAFQMENYSLNAMKRLNDYRNHTVIELPSRPVLPGEFTWSLESDLQDTDSCPRIIRKMLLPEIY